MAAAAAEMRRWVGKLVLFLAGCWVVVLVAGIAGALRGASLDPVNFLVALIPGCAFVPAAYFATRLHTTSEPGELDRLWPKTLGYGLAGLVLLIGSGYGLYRMGQS
jgi:hypothetical protein